MKNFLFIAILAFFAAYVFADPECSGKSPVPCGDGCCESGLLCCNFYGYPSCYEDLGQGCHQTDTSDDHTDCPEGQEFCIDGCCQPGYYCYVTPGQLNYGCEPINGTVPGGLNPYSEDQ